MTVSVGDELAYRAGYGHGRWYIVNVGRITPSGRIVCGRYTLNPDLTVRGSRKPWQPQRFEKVTSDIRDQVFRQRAVDHLADRKWSELTTDQLRAVLKAVALIETQGAGT